MRLDPVSWRAIEAGLSRLADDDTRALLWASAVDLAWTGDLPLVDFLATAERQLPGERHPAIVQYVLMWARNRLLPVLAALDAVTPALASIERACTAALAAQPPPEVAVVLSRALARVDTDEARLRGFVADDDPTLRWTALHRLAGLGLVEPSDIERERTADGTIVADLGALRALAARPDPAAKAAAWARMVEDAHVSNRELDALAEGLWDPERPGLVAAYVERYLTEVPRLAVARGGAFSELMGEDAFPAVPWSTEQLDALRTALQGDLPTILRRAWQDALDDRTAR